MPLARSHPGRANEGAPVVHGPCSQAGASARVGCRGLAVGARTTWTRVMLGLRTPEPVEREPQ